MADKFPTAVLVVEAGRYVDRSLPTASWFDEYDLEAGEYPIEYVDLEGRPVDPTVRRPYYARVKVPAILRRSYRVNRLFTASSVQDEYPDTPATVTLSCYAYEVADDRGMVYVSAPTPEDRWARRPLCKIRTA